MAVSCWAVVGCICTILSRAGCVAPSFNFDKEIYHDDFAVGEARQICINTIISTDRKITRSKIRKVLQS